MVDLSKIEAAAKAANRDDNTMGDIETHWMESSPATVLEMVSMIRERDAVLRQALEALEGCAEYTALIDDFTLHASKQAVKAINEVLK